jgi:hypothetical protein
MPAEEMFDWLRERVAPPDIEALPA